MKFPIDTPESMKDWPFFNQTGGNVMVLFLVGSAMIVFLGILFSLSRYEENRKYAPYLIFAGFLFMAATIGSWHLFDWTVDDYQ